MKKITIFFLSIGLALAALQVYGWDGQGGTDRLIGNVENRARPGQKSSSPANRKSTSRTNLSHLERRKATLPSSGNKPDSARDQRKQHSLPKASYHAFIIPLIQTDKQAVPEKVVNVPASSQLPSGNKPPQTRNVSSPRSAYLDSWHQCLAAQDPKAFLLDKADQYQALILGEEHKNKEMRLFVAGMIPLLKERGFEYLALEIPKAYQEDIEHFRKTGEINENLIMCFTTDFAMFKPPYDKEGYLAILEAARKSKMQLLAIDGKTVTKTDFLKLGVNADALFENLRNNDYINKKGVVQMQFRELEYPTSNVKLKGAARIKLDPIFEHQRKQIYNILQKATIRDDTMVERIKTQILDKNPDARFLVQIGYMHGNKYPADNRHFFGIKLHEMLGERMYSIMTEGWNGYRLGSIGDMLNKLHTTPIAFDINGSLVNDVRLDFTYGKFPNKTFGNSYDGYMFFPKPNSE